MSSALYIAAFNGNEEEVEDLLKNEGINVNEVVIPYGYTPLLVAAKGGYEKVVELLLTKKNININQCRNDGSTPLLLAALYGHVKVVELLLGTNDIQVRGDIQVNQGNKYGVTPLLIAAHMGHVNVVELLIRREDILVNKADNDGNTPLSVAHKNWHLKVAAMLMDKVAKPLNGNQTCIICLDRKPDVVLIPCGHQNLCGACAHQWNEEQLNNNCPTDRIPISKIVPLEDEREELSRCVARLRLTPKGD